MPYDIRKTSDGYHVFNQQTGEDKGKSATRSKAEAHMRALYAHEPRAMSSPGMKMGGVEGMTVDDSYAPVPITHAYMNGKKYPVMTPDPADTELAALHKEAEAKNPAATADMGVPASLPEAPVPGLLGGGILDRLGKGKKPKGKAAPAKPAPSASMPPWMAKLKKSAPAK